MKDCEEGAASFRRLLQTIAYKNIVFKFELEMFSKDEGGNKPEKYL